MINNIIKIEIEIEEKKSTLIIVIPLKGLR